MNKILLCLQRRRHIPVQFSWLDQRLARHNYFHRASAESWLLYLFLVTVADAEGLSYYAERSLCQHLGLNGEQLRGARQQLLALQLIAYRAPLYQVLALDVPAPRPSPTRAPVAQLDQHLHTLRQALKGIDG